MLEKYKGEKPENVVGLEEHKKRPFYKKVSFWVLSALGVFFASCSIYGLVLGSQYVRAVTEAAHIIADANSSSEQESKKPSVRSLIPPAGTPEHVAFNFTFDASFEDGFYLLDGTPWVSGNDQATIRLQNSFITLWYGNTYRLAWDDYCTDIATDTVFNPNAYAPFGSYYLVNRPSFLQGVFNYKAYQTGYQAGYSSGYDTGYAEAQNGTTLHLSVAPEFYPNTGTFHYEWYVDGEVQQTGDLGYLGSNGWQSVDLYRNPGSTARLVFERPGTQFFAEYSISPFGNDGGYPTLNDTNAYNFEDSIWYVPSYYDDFYLRAQGGSANAEHNSDTYDVYLDPEHNERAHIGLWDEGYHQGYSDGMEDNGRWQQGWNNGYRTGKEEGYTNGYQKGVSDTQNGSKALMNMFVTAFQQPFNQVYRFLNFNLLGINVLSLFTALLTLSVGIIIIKKVI